MCRPPSGLQDSLSWELQVLQDAQHYNVVPLVLLNLKGCRQGPETNQLVAAIQVRTVQAT